MGALAVSVALLMVASFALSRQASSSAEKRIYRGMVAGAVLLTVGSLSGVWVVRRRRFLCWNDSNTARRREVRKFLRATAAASSSSPEEPTETAVPPSNTNNTTATSTKNNSNTPKREEVSSLTAQTGVYPVYRRKQAPPGQKQSSSSYVWSRVPSLLLVKGDWIALQIGDVGPASCMLKRYGAAPMYIEVGERLTVEHFASTAEQLTSTLPRGRRTLSVGSSSNGSEGGGLVDDHFLTMCNNMNIFTIVESPIDVFLRRKTILGKSSRIARQGQAVREALFVLSFLFLVVTAAIVLGRLAGTGIGNSSDIALVVQMPLLATLGVLPVVAPAFLFFLEVCGTSRILTTVHEYSVEGPAATTPTSSSSANTPTEVAEAAPAAAASAMPNKSRLLLRYILATSLTRLSLWPLYESLCRFLRRICALSPSHATKSSTRGDKVRSRSKLVRVPPASLNLLEKMGVATAFALVDDELACEPQSIPQQLLIPSGKGLKLLDLCPAYESDSDDDGETDSSGSATGRRPRGRSFDDSDSEQSDDGRQNTGGRLRRKVLLKRMRRNKSVLHKSVRSDNTEGTQEEIRFDVQFEEPNWWQYLPSLKCIGLACLMHEEQKKTEVAEDEVSKSAADNDDTPEDEKRKEARSALVKLVCHERRSRQLRSLAECIGFSTQENAFGKRGDLTPFTERLRLHILSNHLYKNRLALDTHERSSEQSRWWGLIRADSTSIILEDSRTKAFQLLTVGDPAIVTKLCNEAWQGEISTILPLAAIDRQTIIETTNNWKLADLDVAAFSYTPVPHTLETQLSTESGFHVCSLFFIVGPVITFH